jgi:5-methylcytosine-specific restriction enzyme A
VPSYRCNHPTCPALLPRAGYCPAHTRHRHDRQSRSFYNSRKWRDRTAPAVLARDPICRICGRAWSTETDHVTPLRLCQARGIDPHDPANLQGVCTPCHATKTVRESGE